MLKEVFIQLIKEYSGHEKLQDKRWNEIETSYSKSNRHYHTLQHLEVY
jgi:predicted metal-dependent HD superfamily phosphohydrolase